MEAAMPVQMNLRMEDDSAEALQRFTHELLLTLNTETDARAALPEVPAEQGDRGDAVILGQIVLTALTSGTVVALFGVLKAYFERKPSMEIAFKRPDGADFTVKASQLGKSQVAETIALARDFFEAGDG
jgi:hypothetical protein